MDLGDYWMSRALAAEAELAAVGAERTQVGTWDAHAETFYPLWVAPDLVPVWIDTPAALTDTE